MHYDVIANIDWKCSVHRIVQYTGQNPILKLLFAHIEDGHMLTNEIGHCHYLTIPSVSLAMPDFAYFT